MKLLADFLPILLFFVAYKVAGIYVATAVAIATSLLQVGWQWLRHRRVDGMQLVTLLLIVVLGGATLWSHDEWFIKWKPTVVNWLLAAIFAGSQLFRRKPFIQDMLQQAQIQLPPRVWQRLNLSWVLFFLLAGCANLYVIYHFNTDTWVNFKLFGLLGLTVVFVMLQAIYLARHLRQAHES